MDLPFLDSEVVILKWEKCTNFLSTFFFFFFLENCGCRPTCKACPDFSSINAPACHCNKKSSGTPVIGLLLQLHSRHAEEEEKEEEEEEEEEEGVQSFYLLCEIQRQRLHCIRLLLLDAAVNPGAPSAQDSWTRVGRNPPNCSTPVANTDDARFLLFGSRNGWRKQ